MGKSGKSTDGTETATRRPFFPLPASSTYSSGKACTCIVFDNSVVLRNGYRRRRMPTSKPTTNGTAATGLGTVVVVVGAVVICSSTPEL